MHGLGVKTSPVQGETKYRVSIFFFYQCDYDLTKLKFSKTQIQC